MNFYRYIFPLIGASLLTGHALAASNPATIPSVPNVATLQNLGAAAPQYPTVNTQAYTTGFGGGTWIYISSGTATTCSVVANTGPGGTGFWKRQSPIQSAWDCNAVADGSTDQSDILNGYLTTLGNLGGGTAVLLGAASSYAVNGTLHIPANVNLVCQGATIQFTGSSATFDIAIEGSNTSVRNCHINGSGASTYDAIGLNADGISNIHIENNLLDLSSGSGGGFGYQGNRGTSGSPDDDIWIVGNKVIGGRGMAVGNGTLVTAVMHRHYFINNSLVNLSGNGINLNTPCGALNCVAASSDYIVTGNTITISGGTPPFTSGCILLAGIVKAVVSNNTCTNPIIAGIHLEDTTQDFDISHNIIKGIAANQNGIEIISTTAGNVPFNGKIDSNQITAASSTGTTGIFFDTTHASSTNVEVSNNTTNGFNTGMLVTAGIPVTDNTSVNAGTCLRVVNKADGQIKNTTCSNIASNVVVLNSGGIVGLVNIVGTPPATILNNITFTGMIDGITTSGSTTCVNGAQVIPLLAAPSWYGGVTKLHVFNGGGTRSDDGSGIYSGTSGSLTATGQQTNPIGGYSGLGMSIASSNLNILLTSSGGSESCGYSAVLGTYGK